MSYKKQTFSELKKQTTILKRISQQLRGFVSLSRDLLHKKSMYKQDLALKPDYVACFRY